MFRIRSRKDSGYASSTQRDTKLNNSSQSHIDGINLNHVTRLSDDVEPERPPEYKNRFLEHQRQHRLVANIAFDNHADSQWKCECSVCMIDGVHKKEGNKSPKKIHEFFTNFNFEAAVKNSEPEKDFVFVLRRLIPPKNAPYNLRLSVPETIVFIDGEPKLVALTEKDKKIRFIRAKERLTFVEIRKFLLETQKRKENELLMSTEKEQTLKVEVDPYKESLFHEKSEARSFSEKVLPESLGFGLAQKIKGNKKENMKNVVIAEKSTTKEVILVKFKDDTASILTEIEMNNILVKRRTDPFWAKIQFLQMYVQTKQGVNTMQRVYFVYEKDKNDPLFQRSHLEIRYLNGEIPRASEEFFPLLEEEEFEEELFKNDPQKYYLYLLMKIHHFVEVMHSVRITKMGADFVQDDFGTRWLMNICRVQYQNLQKKVEPPKEETQFAKIQNRIQEYGALPLEEMPAVNLDNPKKTEMIKALNVEIRDQYEKLKYHTGMDLKNGELDNSITLDNFRKMYENGDYKFYSPQNRGRQAVRLPIKITPVDAQKIPKSESHRSLETSQTKRNLAPRNINNFAQHDLKFLKANYLTGPKPKHPPVSKLIFTKKEREAFKEARSSSNHTISKSSTERGLNRTKQSAPFVMSTSRGRPSTSSCPKVDPRLSSDRFEHSQMQNKNDDSWYKIENQNERQSHVQNGESSGLLSMNSNAFKSAESSMRDIMDLKRVNFLNRNHSIWLKKLNNKVQDRVSVKLTSRNSSKDSHSKNTSQKVILPIRGVGNL